MKTSMVVLLVVMLSGVNAFAAEGEAVQVTPLGDRGAAVGVDVGQLNRVPAFIRNHWGKLLTGILTVVTVDRVAQHNDWLWYDRGDDAADTARSGAADAARPSGNGNVTVIVNNNKGSVRIAVGTSEETTQTDHAENVSNH